MFLKIEKPRKLLVRISTVIVCCHFIATQLFASSTSKISGLIVDNNSKNPIENANVYIFDQKTKNVLSADVTDASGIFILENIKPGSYTFISTCMGYKKYSINSLSIMGDTIINLGIISLEPLTVNLDQITITGEKQNFEYKNDMLIVNVDKLKESDGETVTDILRKVPFVFIEEEDNRVFLNGISGATILLDGVQSHLNTLDLLSQTNIGNIESIEIILGSSARYDAEGTGGIINIIRKKKLLDQIKTSTSITIGNQDNYKASEEINYAIGNFSMYGGYRNSYSDYDGNTSSATNYILTELLRRTALSNWNQKNNINNFRMGADYFLDSSNTFTTLASFDSRYGNNNNNELNTFVLKNYPDILNNYKENSLLNNNRAIFEYLVNYTYNSEVSGQNLNLDIFYSKVDADNNSLFNYWNLNNDSSVNSRRNFKNLTNFYSISADYQFLPSLTSTIQMGIKSIFRERSSDFLFTSADFIGDKINQFKFNDQIHALYLTFSSSTGRIQYSIGIRGEYVRYIGKQIASDNNFRNTYLDLFPSLNISYDLATGNIVTLTYSRQIDRPYLIHYNPFVTQNSSYSFSSGNPNIKPSYSDRISLIKALDLWGTKVNTTLNYSASDDMIGQPTRLTSDGRYLSIAENSENSKSIGVVINSFHSIMRGFTISPFIIYNRNYYDMRTYNGENPEIIKFRNNFYVFRVNIGAKLFWEMSTLLDLSSASGFNTSISRRTNSYLGTFRIRKSFFGNKLTTSLDISNFIQKSGKYTYSNSDYNSEIISNPSDVRISLSMTYSFNKYKGQNIRKPSEDIGVNE